MISLDLLAAFSGGSCDEPTSSAACGDEHEFLAAFAAALAPPVEPPHAPSGVLGERPGRETAIEGLYWTLRGPWAPQHTEPVGPDLSGGPSAAVPDPEPVDGRPVPQIPGGAAIAPGSGQPRHPGDARIPPATPGGADVEGVAAAAAPSAAMTPHRPVAGTVSDESAAPAPTPVPTVDEEIRPPAAGVERREPVLGQPPQVARLSRPSSSPAPTAATTATDATDVGAPVSTGPRPSSAPEVAPGPNRVDPVVAASSDTAAPTQSTSELGDAPEVSSQLAARIAEIAERLETQPPPRRMIVDLGELRVTVALRGDEVHASLAPLRGGEVPSGWQRDLSDALAARGFTLGDGDQQADGERREGHADRREPPESAPPVRRRPTAATGVQL